jgi:hypothetical protein
MNESRKEGKNGNSLKDDDKFLFSPPPVCPAVKKRKTGRIRQGGK